MYSYSCTLTSVYLRAQQHKNFLVFPQSEKGNGIHYRKDVLFFNCVIYRHRQLLMLCKFGDP